VGGKPTEMERAAACYKSTPLRMNLAPEIQTDWKRYRGTLSLADHLFPKWLPLQYDYSLHFAHLVAIIPGDFL
jgi:hypothetical protein